MKIVVTGGAGFLGWHTRARLHTLTDHEVVCVTRTSWHELPDVARDADAVVHLAGVNRGSDREVEQGNVKLAEDVAAAVRAGGPGCRIVYANSIQAGNDSPYGRGKSRAAVILQEAAAAVEGSMCDVRLPNVFGEHARPAYNTFVATFIDTLLRGETATVRANPVELLHAQDAAQALIDALTCDESQSHPRGHVTQVDAVYEKLVTFQETYGRGEIPALPDKFDVDLFNTYRSAGFPSEYPFALVVNSDQRGELVETVRAHGAGGQSFVSYTKPGMTRGEHYHLSKIERFVVISGRARISLRKVLGDEIIDFVVDSAEPAVVDMPTLWVHNITNIGDTDLITMFWADQLFDPAAPDTYWEPVRQARTA